MVQLLIKMFIRDIKVIKYIGKVRKMINHADL